MKKLIIINGPAGVGKSTVAELVYKQIKPSYLLSCDKIRRFLNDYHDLPREGRALRNKLVLSMLDVLLSENITVVLEQLHTDSSMLDKYHAAADRHRADAYEFFLWIDSEHELLRRFKQRQSGPLKHPNSSLTESRITNYWRKMKNFPETRGAIRVIDTTDSDPNTIANKIIKLSQ